MGAFNVRSSQVFNKYSLVHFQFMIYEGIFGTYINKKVEPHIVHVQVNKLIFQNDGKTLPSHPWNVYESSTCVDRNGREHPCVTLENLIPDTCYNVYTLTHLVLNGVVTVEYSPVVPMKT